MRLPCLAAAALFLAAPAALFLAMTLGLSLAASPFFIPRIAVFVPVPLAILAAMALVSARPPVWFISCVMPRGVSGTAHPRSAIALLMASSSASSTPVRRS